MRTVLATVFTSLLLAPSAVAAGDPEVAALQVGLRTHGYYAGTVDGVLGVGTVQAIERLQRKKGLVADGVPGPQTRKALGRYGKRAPFGRRVLVAGLRGWDVAALQFALAWHGFPSGAFDGILGPSTEQALLNFQRWSGLSADGRAGPSVIGALKGSVPTSPISLSSPMPGPYTDLFGPRGNRFHTGIDYPAQRGAPVDAAASGLVTYAGWAAGGWGRLVTVTHSSGVRTMYAHLSRVAVRVGQRVEVGQRVGRVGSSGQASGPHLHFEVRLRGASVDPLGGLL